MFDRDHDVLLVFYKPATCPIDPSGSSNPLGPGCAASPMRPGPRWEVRGPWWWGKQAPTNNEQVPPERVCIPVPRPREGVVWSELGNFEI